MVTIKEIASLANVSRGTVDKVLNNRPGVKTETRERVIQIAKELNYEPNILGKALVRSNEKLKVGIILTPEYNPFVHEIIRGVKRAQKEYEIYGLEVNVKMLSTLEPAELIALLNWFENENYSGIAVFPNNDEQVIRKVNALSEKGMTIITFNSPVDEIQDLCYIGQNHFLGGQVAAGLISKLIPDQGTIALIISSENLSCHHYRRLGFVERIQQIKPNITITDPVENQDRSDDAFRQTIDFLNDYDDLVGIYVTGGGVSGIGKALDLFGKSGQVKVICHDVTEESTAMLKNQTVDFVIGQNPDLQGYLLVKTFFEYLFKKQVPARSIDIPVEIFTEEMV